jgi:hypothetical protein
MEKAQSDTRPRPLLHPIREARRQLGNIAQSTFYGMVHRGEIRIVKRGRRSFVTDSELVEHVARLLHEQHPTEA